MKRVVWLFVLILFLTGCSSDNKALNQAMTFRSSLLSAQGVQFTANITADYGDAIYSFSMDCQADNTGAIGFTVSEPETLSGITGTISDTGGKITFDDTALFVPLLADDQLAPVSAPWIFLKTLRGGYITSACMEDSQLHITVNDSYAEEAMQLDIWMEEKHTPVRADILYDGRRILSLEIAGFDFL